MKWDNLKQNKCPKCGKDLNWTEDRGIFVCKCPFRISERRFKEIVKDMVDGGIEGYHRKMEEERKNW